MTICLTSLKSWASNNSLVDKRIYKARCTGMSLCQMEENELDAVITNWVLEASLFCGGELNDNQTIISIFCNLVKDFLLNYGFGEFTPSELTLAVYLNCDQSLINNIHVDFIPIEFNARFFNINYAVKLLDNYKRLRNLFDGKIINSTA